MMKSMRNRSYKMLPTPATSFMEKEHFNAMLIVANTMLNLDEFLMKN
jgi:hypothetical protein